MEENKLHLRHPQTMKVNLPHAKIHLQQILKSISDFLIIPTLSLPMGYIGNP